MNTLFLVLTNLVLLITFLFGLYLCSRILIPLLAEKETFFSSPKLGRIKARRRNGKIVSYFDNLARKDKHVNQVTGKIENGENFHKGFWWELFGVCFIGLDDLYHYNIAVEAKGNGGDELKYIEKETSSIFLEGSYTLTEIFTTKDGVRIRVKLQLMLETLDASKGLSMPTSWTIPIFAAVFGVGRYFFGSNTIRALITTNDDDDETGASLGNIRNSDLIGQILDLNTPKVGRVSLEETCGQCIRAVDLIDIGFVDEETRKAYSAPFVAKQEAQKQIKEAEAYANAIRIKSEADKLAADNIATAITVKGNAEAGVYSKKHKGLGSDSRSTAQVIAAEKHSTMEKLTTLVNGGGSVVSLPANK